MGASSFLSCDLHIESPHTNIRLSQPTKEELMLEPRSYHHSFVATALNEVVALENDLGLFSNMTADKADKNKIII